MVGFKTLVYKELLRFWKVSFQTILAPVVSALLYLLIFSNALEAHVRVYNQIAYTAFLVPGLAMMATLQNAFANSSSSLIQSKVTGNIVFILLPPFSTIEFFCAYVFASMVRGMLVGLGVVLVALPFVSLPLEYPMWAVLFALLAAAILGSMGLIVGIWAEKIDQLATFQNFVILPATFLSGVFYSIHALPAGWQAVSHLNPFFYMIDGFRYGFFGLSDVPPAHSLAVVMATLGLLVAVALALLKSGYKLRH